MKPIVIIKETNKNGKFEFTEKELKKLIEQAYEQGFDEGKPKTYTTAGTVGNGNGTVTLPYIQPIYKGEPNLGDWETAKPYNPVVYNDGFNQTSAKPNLNILAWNTATATGETQ